MAFYCFIWSLRARTWLTDFYIHLLILDALIIRLVGGFAKDRGWQVPRGKLLCLFLVREVFDSLFIIFLSKVLELIQRRGLSWLISCTTVFKHDSWLLAAYKLRCCLSLILDLITVPSVCLKFSADKDDFRRKHFRLLGMNGRGSWIRPTLCYERLNSWVGPPFDVVMEML